MNPYTAPSVRLAPKQDRRSQLPTGHSRDRRVDTGRLEEPGDIDPTGHSEADPHMAPAQAAGIVVIGVFSFAAIAAAALMSLW